MSLNAILKLMPVASRVRATFPRRLFSTHTWRGLPYATTLTPLWFGSRRFHRFTNLTDERSREQNVKILFDMFKESDNHVDMDRLLDDLTQNGLTKKDPRLKSMIDQLSKMAREHGMSNINGMKLDEQEFKMVVNDCVYSVCQALRNHFVIPDFPDFCKYLQAFYWKCKDNTSGQQAQYIPQLAKVNPDYWGVSVCTVDGQRFSFGDSDVSFTIQSTGKPMSYAIALSELGSEVVHQYVGHEPSGQMFNELVLDQNHKPHNPMVNAGAIVISSLLLNLIKPQMAVSEKFEWVCEYLTKMSGGGRIGFNNPTYLSEKEANDRNYAIGYYMKEYKCFPENFNLKDTMDFYFQLCSLEVDCETVSTIAATLANGGICPITDEQVITSSSVRDVLSLMHSCGMYDYSGQFAFTVGLPTKSGVAGSIMVVVPNVLGICCWSPPLDKYGNSVRGVQFCEELVNLFNFHQYDNLRHSPHKKDPRKSKGESKSLEALSVLVAAKRGDIVEIRRYFLSGFDLNQSDYDGRTCLHIAGNSVGGKTSSILLIQFYMTASEGQVELVNFLINVCKVDATLTDRWNHTALDNATQFGHQQVIELLTQYNSKPKDDDD